MFLFFQFTQKIIKNSFVLNNFKMNLCDKKPKAEILLVTATYFGIPLKCPVTSPRVHCFNNEKIASLGESTQRLFSLFASEKAGVEIKVEVDHDTGKSCFLVHSTVYANP